MKTPLYISVMLYAHALLLLTSSFRVGAQAPPAGFASVTVSGQWTEAVGLTFTQDGSKMFVWERGGKVWVVVNNQKQLVLDISDEVGSWWDHGLLGFALHPQFNQNGYFYLHYLVDRHHLLNFGTANYNPSANDYYSATISRVARYTATPSGNGYVVDRSSRKILLGETKATGGPSTERSHVVGGIAFGTDNTLIVGIGDGAAAAIDLGSHPNSYYQQALADGILLSTWNIGVFRAQLMNCLSGKILRIDPETGSGLPSNPFFDPLRPDASISKVWAAGVRQPFRIIHKPGTGSHNPDEGNPGVFYFGEVGFNTWEELNVIDRPGLNFGWPIFEGLTPSEFAPLNMPNTGAPNPLYPSAGCSNQYFNFQDLVKQATPSGTATFTNPCNVSQGIPSAIPTFVHTRPIIDWHHGAGPSRTGTFNGQTATESNLGSGPVSGPQFGGSAAVGGTFYTGTDFPEIYQNTFFFGDYSSGWIRNITTDGTDRPVAVRNFVGSNATVVYMATNPTGEGLYYVNFGSEIRRIYYTANRPPVAVVSSDKTYGPSPLLVQFTGNASIDPEGQSLTYSWDFGDGSPPSTSPNPAHTFSAAAGVPTKYVVRLTVRDNQNATDETSLIISVNNTPPRVTITSPLDNTMYPMSGETIYQLRADVSDTEHSAAQLSYAWLTILHHNQHEHPDPIDTSPSTTTHIAPLGCDGQTYYTRIILTVTDAVGASTTKEVRLYPDCAGVVLNPEITWPTPAPITAGTPLSATQLNASASYNGTTIVGTFEYTPAAGTVLNVGNNQPLSVTFRPSNTTLFNEVTRSVAIDVLQGGNTLYRAININGPALLIDGNNWEAGAGAPNLSFTNATAFANQAVALVPATDVNRATMIRSSVWGNGITLAMGAISPGTYQISLYVWEDNISETYSISLEGAVVQSSLNSGSAGTWRKLGPYQATINDGAINITASGGAANFSGLEVWRVGTPVGNQPPVVANPIADRSIPTGSAFTFTFPTNTFSDPNAGTALTYTAILSSGGALPAWLSFNSSTRTFSGTPAAGDVGTLQIQVTASDGIVGGTASDVFALTISPASAATLYRAINLNGPAVVIDGNNWDTGTGAPNLSFIGAMTFANQAVTLVPATDASRASMIRSSVWGTAITVIVGAIPAGTYQIFLYVWEDNFPETYSISLEGTLVQSNFNSGTIGTWRRLGPYQAAINDGTINLTASGGAANLSGMEVWRVGAPVGNQAPVVANPIADRSTPAGSAFSFTFPTTTFSDPNAGTVLTYAATLFPTGALPAWLSFNSSTRTFSGTSTTGDVGILQIQLTASDGAGGSVSDVFALTVSPNQSPIVSNAIVDQNVTVGALLSFAFPGNTFTDPDAGTVLSYSASLSPSGTLPGWLGFNTATRTFSGVPTTNDIGTLQLLVTASDGIAGGTVSDVFALTISPASATTLYRAINLNGPAVVIDGNNWEAGTGAPNLSFTGAMTFANQAVALVPATDANRASMIRSSVWGTGITVIVGAIPAGSYQIFLYVWEDNISETYSISLEGTLVQSSFNSGSAGTWKKLGPYQATINDGTINLTASGGAANLSGIEVWRVGAPVGNQPPVVANPIADRSSPAGSAFSFTFPTTTFSDPNAGTVLTYAATLSPTGALPAWLSFNATTRTFSGTPAIGDVGTFQIQVTASDGAGGSIGDVFAMTVTQPSATSVYRAINLNGPALVIDGINWETGTGAPNLTFTGAMTFANQAVTLVPATDANRASMIRSSVWGTGITVIVGAIPVGTYQIFLYVWEDNFPETYSISLEGTLVQSNLNSGTTGTWRRLGPYQTAINDGTINLTASGGAANLSGLEVWRVNSGGASARTAIGAQTDSEIQDESPGEGLDLVAFPNPFSDNVHIVFTVTESTTTRLTLYDVRGLVVKILFQAPLKAGYTQNLETDAAGLPDGVYVLELVNGRKIQRIKLAISR